MVMKVCDLECIFEGMRKKGLLPFSLLIANTDLVQLFECEEAVLNYLCILNPYNARLAKN